MEFCLRFLGFIKFLQNNNHQAVNKMKCVEKRKILYFGLARNLIQHWISPNQDDLSYSARTFISG